MKLNRFSAALALIAAMACLPAIAGAGSRYGRSAGYEPGYGHGSYGGGQGGYVGAPYRIYPDENRWGRSYYYEDPSTGRRSQYLSNLTACYDEPGHQPLVYMIDIRTGWVINTYARERGQWCKVSSGLATLGDYGPRRGYDRGYGQLGYWNR